MGEFTNANPNDQRNYEAPTFNVDSLYGGNSNESISYFYTIYMFYVRCEASILIDFSECY